MRYQKQFTSKTTVKRDRKWFVFDAEGKILGRLAVEICRVLRGRHTPDYTMNVDSGDGVLVVNASKVVLTGNKRTQKVYRHYSGYIGGLKEIPCEVMFERHPDRIIQRAVKGMMPKTKQARAQIKRLRVFASETHAMDAQKPIVLDLS